MKYQTHRITRITFRISSILFLGLVMQGCDENITVSSWNAGVITGKVIFKSGEGCGETIVSVLGTHFSATTDDSGYYRLPHLPAGEYELLLQKTDMTYNPVTVQVISNQTTVAPDIIVSVTQNSPKNQSIVIESWNVFTCKDSLLPEYPDAGLRNYRHLYRTTADCIWIGFFILPINRESNEAADMSPVLLHNSDTVSIVIHEHGYWKTAPIHRSGFDTVVIFVESQRLKQFFFLNPLPVESHDTLNFLKVVGGNLSLRKVTTPAYPEFIVFEDDTCITTITREQKIDWDCYIVNVATMDTCGWKNRSLNWINNPDDPSGCNVSFHGDIRFHPSTNKQGHSYETEIISSDSLPDGEYDIYIQFYDGPADSLAATPLVNIFMGKIRHIGKILKFHSHLPDQPIKKGETWYAGRIRYPELLFEPGQ